MTATSGESRHVTDRAAGDDGWCWECGDFVPCKHSRADERNNPEWRGSNRG